MKHTPTLTTRLLLSGMLWLLCSGAALAAEKEIMGWVERVEIVDSELTMKAKLDSGAKTSSLDASDIEIYREDGKRWVRFTITDADSQQSSTLERPLHRYVRIIRHSGEHQRRPVVELEVCLGHYKSSIEFSLIDRSNFIYPVLLGRSALAGQFLLDLEDTFLSDPDCAAGSGSKDAD
jgi:hypothetical protein